MMPFQLVLLLSFIGLRFIFLELEIFGAKGRCLLFMVLYHGGINYVHSVGRAM